MRSRKLLKDLKLFLGFGSFIFFIYKIAVLNINNEPLKRKFRETSSIQITPYYHEITGRYDKRPRRLVTDFDCRKVIDGNVDEIAKAQHRINRTSTQPDEEWFINHTSNCKAFVESRGYLHIPVSDKERNFPIAYSILLYKDVEQAEQLLHSIYRPHNIYCIHVDKSAKPNIYKAMHGIGRCLQNVFMVSEAVDVMYNSMSRLKAELNCMKDLLSYEKHWKYFINLPSQEFPLKTNKELVDILSIFGGRNIIEGITNPRRMMRNRFKHKYKVFNNGWMKVGLKGIPPHNITIVKGSAYGVFSRDFLTFAFEDVRAKDLLNWMEDILSPDEYFWATLNHDKSLMAPGGYTGVPDHRPFIAVYASWILTKKTYDPCKSMKFQHGHCVFGLGDLTFLTSRKQLFANKFDIRYDPAALDCLEEWIFNKTYSPVPIDLSWYKNITV